MSTETQIKELVKEKYSQIAGQSKDQNESSCCGATACCGDEVYNICLMIIPHCRDTTRRQI